MEMEKVKEKGSSPQLTDHGYGEQKTHPISYRPQAGRLAPKVSTFLAGSCAGVFSTIALQPLDVVKTHIQAAAHSSRPPKFADVIQTILQRDGARGLWRGTGPACLRVGLGAGFYFTILGPLLSSLSRKQKEGGFSTEQFRDKLPVAATLSAGALARSMAALLVCPITVVKTRMEYEATSGLHYASTLRAITLIARTEGFKGLYSGLLPTILRDAPYSGLYLLMYNRARVVITDWQLSVHNSEFIVNFIAGAIAGGGATLLTHPPDVIRTKLQLECGNHPSIVSTIHTIIQRNGVRGLFAGVLPRAGRRALHQAFSWTIFEEIIRWTTAKRQS